jgi:periplasmic protein CpxP/Spy
MKKFNWLAVLVAGLVLLNIGLLGTVWLKKKPEAVSEKFPPKHDARDLLISELELDSMQVKSFDSLRKDHFNEIRGYRDAMRDLKDDLFQAISKPDGSQDSIAAEIGKLQSKIELATFNHFAALRNICNEDQKEKFDEVIHDVLRSMGRPQGHGDGPPPRGRPPRDDEHPGPPPGE